MINENYGWKDMPDIYICEGIYKNAFISFTKLKEFKQEWQYPSWTLEFTTSLFNPDVTNYLISKSHKAAPFTLYIYHPARDINGADVDMYYKFTNCKVYKYYEIGVYAEGEPNQYTFILTANGIRETITAEDMPVVE